MSFAIVTPWLAGLTALSSGLTVFALIAVVGHALLERRRQLARTRLRYTFVSELSRSRLFGLEQQMAAGLARRDPSGRLARVLAEADLTITPEALAVRVCIVSVVAALGAMATSGEPLLTLFGAAMPPVLTYAWVLRRRAQIQERLAQQLPDALTTISNSLLAGASLPQAIEQTAPETPRPVSTMLWRAVDAYRVGRSFDEILTEMGARVGLQMLDVVVAAMQIHRDAGGNLGELLGDAAELMRDDLRLQRDLTVATAQAKLSAQVVGALPIIIVVILALTGPENLAPFFKSLAGQLLFLGAGILELVGFLLVVKASSVRF